MRKLLTFLIALAAVFVLVCSSSTAVTRAQRSLLLRDRLPISTKSYTFAGTADNNGSVGNTWTVSTINIGPASASRLVVVCLSVQNNPALTVSVNGVSLTQAAVNGSANQAALWYGSIPSGSGAATIVVTGGNFLFETMLVYYATGLGSNTPVGTTNGVDGGAAGSLTVNAGDFIFAADASTGSAPSWTGSTQVPTGTHSDTTNATLPGFSADWIVSAGGTFNTAIVQTAGQYAAANWWKSLENFPSELPTRDCVLSGGPCGYSSSRLEAWECSSIGGEARR